MMKRLVWLRLGASKALGPIARSVIRPQNLEPMDLKRVRKAVMTPKQCTACSEEYVPALEDVPPARALDALARAKEAGLRNRTWRSVPRQLGPAIQMLFLLWQGREAWFLIRPPKLAVAII